MSQKPPKNRRPSPSTAAAKGLLLSPEWVAAFTVYWKSHEPDQRSKIMQRAEAAVMEITAERCICTTQIALRELGIVEVQIIKLILTRYLDHIRLNTPRPAHNIADEVLATLRSISNKRRMRKGRD